MLAISGTNSVSSLEPIKWLLVLALKLEEIESDESSKPLTIFENVMTALTAGGTLCRDLTNAKSAIITFRDTSLNAGNVTSWPAPGVRGTDSETSQGSMVAQMKVNSAASVSD